MATAALAINAAAVDAPTLPGDFNFDGIVDAADFVAWRKGMPADGGYNAWRENFGRTLAGQGGMSRPASVPEPTSLLLGVLACSRAACRRNHRARTARRREMRSFQSGRFAWS